MSTEAAQHKIPAKAAATVRAAAAPVQVYSRAAAAQAPLVMPARFQSPYIARFAGSGILAQRERPVIQRRNERDAGRPAQLAWTGLSPTDKTSAIRQILRILKIVDNFEDMLLSGTVTPHLTSAARAISEQARGVNRATHKTHEYLQSLLWSIIADVTKPWKSVTAGDVADRIKLIRGRLGELNASRSRLRGLGSQLEKAGTMLMEHGDKMRKVGELLSASWDSYAGASLVFRGISIAKAGSDLRSAGEDYNEAWTKIDQLYLWYSRTELILMKIYKDKISAAR